MRYFFDVIKDASLYDAHPLTNTGKDEILEVGKTTGTYPVRSMLTVDVPAISASISAGTVSSDATFELRLRVARADDLRLGQVLELNIVSRSWVEGPGYYYQYANVPFSSSRDPVGGYLERGGTSWRYRQSGSLWSVEGGEYYPAVSVSKSIADPVTDMTFDITSAVQAWVSGTYANNGLMLKFPAADEADATNNGNIRFFSRDTHTVHAPTLTANWNDQLYVTGTLTASSVTETLVQARTLQARYHINERVRVEFSVRDRFPQRTFDTTFTTYAGNRLLPSASYFSIVDAQSKSTIIPFDDASRISCDGTTNYCTFYINGMYPGRFYQMRVRVTYDGYEQIYDLPQLFSVDA